MKAILAIAVQTMRSSLRSRVFHVLAGLTALAMILLPITVSGDGSAMGQLQISLTYSLGVVTALISTATLWLSCTVLAREIEGYQMHLVVSKPAPRWYVWTGKWLGVFAMHALLFVLAALVILGLVHWKLQRGNFAQHELDRLRSEVMVGRRVFHPEQPDFLKIMEREYQERLQAGTLSPEHSDRAVKGEILRQMKARTTEVPFGVTREWRFTNVRAEDPEATVYMRYRLYVNSTSTSDQRMTYGVWGVWDPNAEQEGTFAVRAQQDMGGGFHELTFPASLVAGDGTVLLRYLNQDPQQQSVIFQISDGPALLTRVTGFASNYLRSVFLVLLQLAFLAALGCTVGAVFSTPVAIFVAVSYLVIGLTVQAAVSAPVQDELGGYEYRNAPERLAHYLAIGVGKLVVSVKDFEASSDLAKGRLIELTRMGGALFGLIVLRSLPLAGLGVYLFNRRELGTVIRR